MELKSLLLPEEENEWKDLVNSWRIGPPPDPTNPSDVQCFRAMIRFRKLIDLNDESLVQIPKGDFVLFHIENGVQCFGSKSKLRDEFDDEDPNLFIFQYDPEKKFLPIAKISHSIPYSYS